MTPILTKFPISIITGSAIRCYECNSHLNPNCSMNIPPDSLSIECGDHKHGVSYTFCRKITQVIEFTVNNRKCHRERETNPLPI